MDLIRRTHIFDSAGLFANSDPTNMQFPILLHFVCRIRRSNSGVRVVR